MNHASYTGLVLDFIANLEYIYRLAFPDRNPVRDQQSMHRETGDDKCWIERPQPIDVGDYSQQ